MKKVILKISVFILLMVVAVTSYLWMDMRGFMSSPMHIPDGGVIVEVRQGSNITRVVNSLVEKKIIENSYYLRWYLRLQKNANKIHVGEYMLEPGMTPKDFLAMMLAGKVMQYSITIVEGWTFRQLMEVVQNDPNLSHELTGLSYEQIMLRLGYKDVHPEGRFMPDTYLFPRGMSDIAFLSRAYQAMEDFLQTKWPDRDTGIPVKTPYEALILASIVEKETGLESERKAIAGVFSRRLQKRMRLQTDPTVIYGMGENYNGNIRKRDLQTATPYNTYKIYGLPPTPIAMPGRDAIDAVLHPAEGNELYFVSRGDGSHKFSATLKEHNEAVIKYQLKGRRKPFSSYTPGKNK